MSVDEIAERWSRARLGAPGVVSVPDIEDPRADVAALLAMVAAAPESVVTMAVGEPEPVAVVPVAVVKPRKRSRGER